MNASMASYSNEQLAAAVADSRSWREVLRRLGLAGTSGAAIRGVRARAAAIGAPTTHFAGRRWTDADLHAAVRGATSWRAVADILGVRDGAKTRELKAHAARLGIELAVASAVLEPSPEQRLVPHREHLSRAGALMAASWFSLCGCDVSWPLEPCRYDLVVRFNSHMRRVQVKTTSTRAGDTWKVYLSTSRAGRSIYSPDEVDDFFVIDGDLSFYLIPIAAVGGLQAIHLSKYARFKVAQPTAAVNTRTASDAWTWPSASTDG